MQDWKDAELIDCMYGFFIYSNVWKIIEISSAI